MGVGIPEVEIHCESGNSDRDLVLFSLIPRLPWNANMYRGESLVSFLCKHDVIKIGPKQKGNVLRVVQPTMLQRSVCMIFDAR